MTRPDILEDPNWKNVGNWHWVSKDVAPYCKTYLTAQLRACTLPVHTNMTWQFVDLTEFSGDCTLSVRKGKLITIYDLNFTLSFTGHLDDDTKVSGKLHVPEIMNDFCNDDVVFELTLDPTNAAYRTWLQTHLYPEIRRIFHALPDHVVQDQSQDVYIANAVPSALLPTADLEERKKLATSFLTTPATPATTATPVATTVPSSMPAYRALAGKVSTPSATPSATPLTFKSTMHACSVQDVLDCFVVDAKVKHWTQGRGRTHGQEHTPLQLLDTPYEFLRIHAHGFRLEGRKASWTRAAVVDVGVASQDGRVVVSVTHSRVDPDSENEGVEREWREILGRIKCAFGYGGGMMG